MQRQIKEPRSQQRPQWLSMVQQHKKKLLPQTQISDEKRLKLFRQEWISRIDPKLKPQLRWLELWAIDSLFSENVDLANSQAALAIPLVDLAVGPGLHIALSMTYTSGDVSTNSLIGNGWAIHNIGQDFIGLNHKQSSFTQNHEYNLSLEGRMVKLVPSEETSDQFTIPNEADVRVTFFRQQNRWTVDAPNMRMVYGTSSEIFVPDALQWSLHWPRWRGPGTDEETLVREVVSWYLVSREETKGLKRKLYYKYRTDYRTTSNKKPFTSVILLETIFDHERQNVLNLIYDTKTKDEYVEKAYKTAEGDVQFPVYLLQNHYLLGFHLETSEYQQQLQFEYEKSPGGIRKLTRINQVFNENGGERGKMEEIFHFKYQLHIPNQHLLQELEIPAYRSSLLYAYQPLQIPLVKFNQESLNTQRIPTVENVQITQNHDTGVLAYDLGTGGVYLDVYNNQFTAHNKQLYTSKDTAFDETGRVNNDPNEIERFASLLFPNLIAVMEEAADEKRLHMFIKNVDTGTWPLRPNRTIGMSKNALFRYSDTLIVVAKNDVGSYGQLLVIQPNTLEDLKNQDEDREDTGLEEFELELTNGHDYRIERLVVQDNVILAYNSYTLHGWQRETQKTKGDWKETVILQAHSMEKELFQTLDTKDEHLSALLEQINLNGLQISDKMILLSTLDYRSGSLHMITTNANLILVDDQLQATTKAVIQVKSEYILDLENKEEPTDGLEMTFKYIFQENKYKVSLVNVAGRELDKICKEAEDKYECKKEVIKHYMEDSSFLDQIKDMILFDYEAFMTFQLDRTGVVLKNTKLKMTGVKWEPEQLHNMGLIRLGTDFVLETKGNSTHMESNYTLYRQNPEDGGKIGRTLGNWTINSQRSGMSIGYPAYMAIQPDVMYQPELVVFREQGTEIDNILLGEPDEQILRVSNNKVLFSIMNATDPLFPSFNKRLTIRRVESVVPSAPLIVLSKTEVRFVNESRVRQYENELNRDEGNAAQESIVRVIPGESRSYTGYYEEITVIPFDARTNVTKTQNWFDSQGKLVVTRDVWTSLREQEQSRKNQTEQKKWHTIWDNTGQLELSDISPYNASQHDVVYFGFEPYENNSLPFDYETRFVSTDNSLTGTRALKLMDGNSFSGSLTPTNQQGTYVVSAWLRFPIDLAPTFEFEAPLKNFMASLTTQTGNSVIGVYAQMKRQQRDWIFAEIILDLDKIRKNVYTEMYRYSEAASHLPTPNSTYFTIHLMLDSKDNSTWVDIDHIRFAPINFDWTVTVYDPRTAWEKEQILSGGGILRNIYNRFSNEIATVNEYNQVEQFKSLSRTGVLFPKPVIGNQLQMQQVRQELVVVPQEGYYERFDDYSLKNMWKIEDWDQAETWRISKGRVEHLADSSHQLDFISIGNLLDHSSSALRFHVNFPSTSSMLNLSLDGLHNLIQIRGNGTLNVASCCTVISNLPSTGELFVHVNEEAMWIWFDGVLLIDQKFDKDYVTTTPIESPWKNLTIVLQGTLEISDAIFLSNPQISVEYFNAWGERTQTVQLDSSDSVLVSETIYDEVGRDAIKTKATKIFRSRDNSPLLTYHSDFVTNRCASDPNSVFKSGLVQGLANYHNPTDEGYPYFRSLYHDDMLRETKVDGLPGKIFSTVGTFTKKHSRHSGTPFLQILFPTENGFHEKVTNEPNGNVKVSVQDKQKNEVAIYVKVVGYNSLLTINEYDTRNQLVKTLPPKYHDHMRTHLRTKPWTFGEENLTSDEKYWQGMYGTHYIYGGNNQLLLKKAPDQRTKGFMYDAMGNVRFMYNLPETMDTNKTFIIGDNVAVDGVVYMLHIGQNKPVEIGFFKKPVKIAQLKAFQNGTTMSSVGEPELHQKIIYSETHSDPELRGRLRMFLTYDNVDNDSVHGSRNSALAPPHQELLKFNSANHVTMKTSNALYTDSFTNYRKHYEGNKLKELVYPLGQLSKRQSSNQTHFSLFHKYDKMRRVTGLGKRTNLESFARITYNPAGQVEQEFISFGPYSNGTRSYAYNSPGLLTRITDPFLSQEISFVEGGYGQYGHGDGIVMSSIMTAPWSNISLLSETQKQWFTISQDEYADDKHFKMCLQALKRVGVLNEDTNIPLNFLTKSMLSLLPLSCSGETGFKLMKIIAKHLPPTNNYGHSFNYGSHQELTKAKFYGNKSSLTQRGPLKIASFFEEIPEVTDLNEAEAIWDVLTRGQFLLVDGNPEEKMEAIGKEGLKGLFRHSQLAADLQEVDSTYSGFSELLMLLLYHNIESQEMISLADFQETMVNWHGYNDTPTAALLINRARQAAEKIFNMLQEKEYLSGNLEKLLHEDYMEAMVDHKEALAQVTKCLITHFEDQIGTNVFDFESFYNDPNGNRVMYYQGLTKYEMEYEGSTNKVKRLKITNPYGGGTTVTQVEHDNNGNVCKAGHRDIQLVKYHPVTNRPLLIILGDGRRILLKYDAQGERTLKRVFSADPKNQLVRETKYLRDENGRVLMDKLTMFNQKKEIVKELESTYIYGPRGHILGFYRNGEYYNVFTDHSGSTRLISYNGSVVAGYDYWPYGELLRSYGDEDCHLAYRFTGQEYDEETGLYNYHARLYDPTIGRFFQPDPKNQYYSPYVYGGNNPVSLVDPDGEFFWQVIVAVVVAVGAIIAGHAVNGTFNPLKWNWKSPKTLVGMLSGALSLLGLVSGIYALVGGLGIPLTILVGLAGTYLKMAEANDSWNPINFDWSQHLNYNIFTQGISLGLSIFNNILTSLNLSRIGQVLFPELSGERLPLLPRTVSNQRNLNLLEYDVLDSVTNSAIQEGFMMGKGSPEQASRVYKAFADMSKNANWNEMLKNNQGSSRTFFKQISENPKHPLWNKLGKAVISFIATGKDQGTVDLTKWDLHSTSTFEGVLNTFKIATDIKDMAEVYRKRDWSPLREEIFQEELLDRLQEAVPVLESIVNWLTSLSDFYGSAQIPGTLKLLMRMGQNSTDKAGDDSVRQEMQHMMDGLRAGSEIYPVFPTEIAHLVDCEIGPSRSDKEFAKCSIGLANRLMARRNQEFSKMFFIPSQRYQSPNSFLSVESTDDPKEYLEQIWNIFQFENPSNPDHGYHESFLVGTVFHSILNSQKLYITIEDITDLEIMATHIGLLEDKEGKNHFHVRTIISLQLEAFEVVRDHLESHLKQTRYECYLPDSLTVDNIKAEAIVISTKFTGVDVHVITKAYQPSICQTNVNKFMVIPQSTEETVFEKFSRLIDDTLENMEEKEKHFQKYFQALVDVTSEANLFLPNLSFLPFIYGLMHGNVRKTYDVSMEIDQLSKNLLIVPGKNSKGQETMHGIPLVISTGQTEIPEKFLYKSAHLTLSNEALIGRYSQGILSTSRILIPKFESILGLLDEEIDQDQIENVIRYIFYNNHVVMPTNTENSHFVSNFILGEFLSQTGTPRLEIFVLAPSNPNDQSRLLAQRLFFLRNTENNSCALLNVIESSKPTDSSNVPFRFEFDPNIQMGIPFIPDVEIGPLKMVQINLNSNSIDGWSSEKNLDGFPERHFWQGINISTVDHHNLARDTTAFLKLDPTTYSNPDISFSIDSITTMFSTLVNDRFQILLNDDQDFQSLIMGFLMGASTQIQPNHDGVTMVLRQLITDMDKSIKDSTHSAKLSLLSIAKGVVIPQTEQVLLASLRTISDGEENDDIETKMKEARNELKIYQCSNGERFKETFKITRVSAVYDSSESAKDPEGNRVYFEMDAEKLSETSCDAAENPFRKYIQTGSSRTNENKDEGFFSSMKTKFGQYLFGNQNTGEKHTEPLDTHIEKCHLGAWTTGQYSMDGITCTSGKSRIAVFQNIEPSDIVRASSRGDPFHLVGDTYNNGECTPISFNGRESVACKGDKSTLIYTPYLEPRVFDELDGNLMLGRVAIHLGGKIWNFARNDRVNEGKDNHVVTEDMVDLWESGIKDIQAMIGKWEGDVREMDWVKEDLRECEEMVDNVKMNNFKTGPETIEIVEERLLAIMEDLTEQVLYAKTGSMFGDDGNEMQRESRNVNYEGMSSVETSNTGLRSGYGNNLFSGVGQIG